MLIFEVCILIVSTIQITEALKSETTFSEPGDGGRMGTQVCLSTRLKPHEERNDQVHLCSPLPRPRRESGTICFTHALSTHRSSKQIHESIFNSQGLPCALVNYHVISLSTFFGVLNSSQLQWMFDLHKCYVWGSSDIRKNSLSILSVYLRGMFEATPPQKIGGFLSLMRDSRCLGKKEVNSGKRKKLQGN